VKQVKDAVAWIETRAAWIGLRWTYVSYVSGCPEDFIRLRNDVVMNIPKSFWRFSLPSIRTLGFHGKKQAVREICDFLQHGLRNPFGKGKQSSFQNQY
jgi:hypothetical protein